MWILNYRPGCKYTCTSFFWTLTESDPFLQIIRVTGYWDSFGLWIDSKGGSSSMVRYAVPFTIKLHEAYIAWHTSKQVYSL